MVNSNARAECCSFQLPCWFDRSIWERNAPVATTHSQRHYMTLRKSIEMLQKIPLDWTVHQPHTLAQKILSQQKLPQDLGGHGKQAVQVQVQRRMISDSAGLVWPGLQFARSMTLTVIWARNMHSSLSAFRSPQNAYTVLRNLTCATADIE
ncbi:hypothetical protein ABBQ32_003979 [Trebouxia sp. C0010 RCD-2024]